MWQANDDDVRGNITEVLFGNDALVTSQYRPENGLLQSRVAALGGVSLQNHSYTFDDEGNLRSRSDLRTNITQNFCYDPLYRLTDHAIGGGCTDDTNGSYSGTAYAYDIHGNILRKDGITDYQYGQNAQNAGPHAVSFANGGSYIYDNAGRMVSSPGQRTLDYSLFGKPTYMGFNNGYQTEITYGALQNRVQRGDIEGGLLTLTTYVGKDYERIEQSDGSTEHRHYLGDWGVHIYTENTASTEQYTVYLTRDHIGSVVSKSDDRSGGEQAIKFHANEPWGRRQSESWGGLIYDRLSGADLEDMTFGTARGFTDHEHLDGVGLIHMNGRVYDPVVGRFVSPDPWIQDPENSQSFNRYSYVWNNPLSHTDPTGEIVKVALTSAKLIYKAYKAYKKSGKLNAKKLKEIGADELVGIVDDINTVFSGQTSVLDKMAAVADLGVGTDLTNKKTRAAKKAQQAASKQSSQLANNAGKSTKTKESLKSKPETNASGTKKDDGVKSDVGGVVKSEGKRRKNRIPDKGEPGAVAENPAGTTRKRYGPDGNVQKEWNKGHGPKAPKNEQNDHIHDYKPNPRNPSGRGKRMLGREPRSRDLNDMDLL